MKKIILLLLALTVTTVAADARKRMTQKTALEQIKENPRLSASNLLAYPYPASPLPELTPAPEGYRPFYISHYGRHGSRWIIYPEMYSLPVEQLAKGEKYGKLTERGKQVLAELRKIEPVALKHLGELTDVGAEQHRGIAQRMYRNFPDVFAGAAKIEANSTTSIRCILSMENELQEFCRLNPAVQITHDASRSTMPALIQSSTEEALHHFQPERFERYSKTVKGIVKEMRKDLIKPERFLSVLFTDKKFAADSIDGEHLMQYMFTLTGNQQSHHTDVSFYDLFTLEELYKQWECMNAEWYMEFGPGPQTESFKPFQQGNTLRDILRAANEVVEGRSDVSATLRFGHDSVLLPVACLMELDDCNVIVDDIKELPDKWQNFNIYCMGCNIQLVFYRKPGSDDVLVKALLNEQECSMPVETDCAPYYHWKDLNRYYTEKLANAK